MTFYLNPGAPGAGELSTDQRPGRGKETLVDNYSFTGAMLAQAEFTEHRLLYLTPELKNDVRISGVPTITIKASADKPAVNLSAWLVVLPSTTSRNPKITDNLITRGWADLQNYQSLRESSLLAPGRFYQMTFNLEPDDQIIPAGKQIGLLIFSSDKEFTLHPKPGTKLTVDLDGTSITIPIVGGTGGILFK